MVFAPAPQLTVTVEDRAGRPDLHLHPGGQGVWQARAITLFGVPATLVAGFGGETGVVLRALLAGGGSDADADAGAGAGQGASGVGAGRDGLTLHPCAVAACNGGYVHDRRSGERTPVAEMPGEPLARHDLDTLYEAALLRGMAAGTAVLSGPTAPGSVPAELYRRLAADLTATGCRVLADLSGDLLGAVLDGGLAFLKVSDEELLADGRAAADDPPALVAAMRALRGDRATVVVVSRGARPALALLPDGVYEVHTPPLQQVDSRGAGDAMTGVVAGGLARGWSWPDTLRAAGAAGALSVTQRGLSTGSAQAIGLLAERVRLRRCEAAA